MPTDPITLDDKYTRTSGRIFLTGVQALTRLPLVQAARDARVGLHTAGFVSGYRGSPLAGLDKELDRAAAHLARHRVHFEPGINEELAATAVWGSQMTDACEGARYDGVYAMWYGKAPGLDRASDALKHGNAAGSSLHGGVLVVAGDDHACKSSTLPSQSEYALMDAGVPVLNPAGVQEVLDYGLLGWAMSRYSGCWVGMIALADTMDSSATVHADLDRIQLEVPRDFTLPPGGVHYRIDRSPLDQEENLHRYKLYAALAFARANGLDRTVLDAPDAKLGIVTTGKAYLAVRQALEDLGIGEREASEIGLRLYKVGMPWPLDRVGIAAFSEGLEEILVVEEKRAVIENQIKEQLYDTPGRPRVVGKFDENREWLLPSMGDLHPGQIARVIARRLEGRFGSERIDLRLRQLEASQQAAGSASGNPARTPFYCSGCPHNLSTRLPEGSRGLAGIGCHYMVRWMERETDTFSQMGGEGAQWIGQAPFTDEEHVFANLGDGTYFHSGLLAIRAAVAAGVNITYKILYNDAVAMTGGQSVDGQLSVPMLTHQLAAEGVARIAVLRRESGGYGEADLAPGTRIHDRSQLDALQRELRETPGCTALVYDQTCAAELRRRRKRGEAVDPPRRLFVNDAVCEGCGDCSRASNCVSVEPLETELGRKRRINQSSCNKDESCLDGHCPSFVSVEGGRLRRAAASSPSTDDLPIPSPLPLDSPHNLLITGVGGTGVVTLAALVGMAAHLDGHASTCLDMTGLAQKGGAVVSHVRVARAPEDIFTPHIAARNADALIGCDLVVAAGGDALMRLDGERTHSVVDSRVTPTAAFVRDNDIQYDVGQLVGLVEQQSRSIDSLDASGLAAALLGDTVATNTLLLGIAFQRGLVPVSRDALVRAIELNGVAVETNLRALEWGRLWAHDRAAVEAVLPEAPADSAPSRSLEERVERRAAHLALYQNEAYAARYRRLVATVEGVEEAKTPGRRELTDAVARSYHKLLAYKDEYEVARLHTSPEFRVQLDAQFEGDVKLSLHLAPPLFSRPDPVTGRTRKRAYGPWIFPVLKLLARGKGLRGTVFDLFGVTAERRMERQMIREFESTVVRLLEALEPANHATAVEIAALPLEVRGFGEVKLRARERIQKREAELLDRLEKPDTAPAVDMAQLLRVID